MGARGPVPKRSIERRRRNLDSQPDVATVIGAEVVTMPEPDGAWHAIALNWYRSLGESGQSQFYEPSDWAAAAFVAETMSRALNADKVGANMLAALMGAMTDLLTTEGARRRARVEIERDGTELASVDDLDAYRGLVG